MLHNGVIRQVASVEAAEEFVSRHPKLTAGHTVEHVSSFSTGKFDSLAASAGASELARDLALLARMHPPSPRTGQMYHEDPLAGIEPLIPPASMPVNPCSGPLGRARTRSPRTSKHGVVFPAVMGRVAFRPSVLCDRAKL